MTEACFTSRGLVSLGLILRQFSRTASISYPDFLCDDVVDLLQRTFKDRAFPYRIDHRLRIDWDSVEENSVLYAVDYFGRETDAFQHWDGAIIHDAVWMWLPLRDLGKREWWFNSARKYAWPLRGSALLSRAKLDGGTDAAAFGDALATTVPQKWARQANYDKLAEHLSEFGIHEFWPHYASVYPMIVQNRDEVMARLAAEDIHLPGMWANRQGFANDLYRTLMLVPCDGRFGVRETERRAERILAAIESSAS